MFYRELSGKRLSPQETALPALEPDHAMTGRPLSLERTITKFANVPEEDTRRSFLEIWKEHNELTDYCLHGELPSAGTIYEIIAGLRPTALEPLWQALRVGLDLPLEVNWNFLAEEDRVDFNTHNPLFHLPLSERVVISQLVRSIQAASRESLIVFIRMIPELEILGWTLGIWDVPEGVSLRSIPLEERADKVMGILDQAHTETSERGDYPIIPTFIRSHFTDLLAAKSVELCRLYAELFDHLPNDPSLMPCLGQRRRVAHQWFSHIVNVTGFSGRERELLEVIRRTARYNLNNHIDAAPCLL